MHLLKVESMMMKTYVVLLRGINVGGKNTIPMASLKACLSELGYANASTYIASGNVFLASDETAPQVEARIEAGLIRSFKLDSQIIKALALSRGQLQAVIENKPKGFGEQPKKYHSDVIFLIHIPASRAMLAFNPRQGVGRIWSGRGVIYSQRLSVARTRSRLNQVMGSPLYKSMTIRNWNTTTKLFELLKAMDARD